MARGRGGKKAYKPTGRPRRPGAGPEEEVSEEEEEAKFQPRSRGLGRQANTVGMLPPSDSDEDGEEKGEASAETSGKPEAGKEDAASSSAPTAAAAPPAAAAATAPAAAKPAAPAAAKKPAAQDSDSDEETDDDSDEESDESEDGGPPQSAAAKGGSSTSGQQPAAARVAKPAADYLSEQSARKPKNVPEERDPEEIRKEMERLALIRNKREEDRKRRVAVEGWDRFAPVTDTNRPPGTVPTDHPSAKA